MISLQIISLKHFMGQLLGTSAFDGFLLEEASFTTATTVTIDGRVHEEFYTQEERETGAAPGYDFMPWSALREMCFSLIRGKHTPLGFKIVFRLKPELVQELLTPGGINTNTSRGSSAASTLQASPTQQKLPTSPKPSTAQGLSTTQGSSMAQGSSTTQGSSMAQGSSTIQGTSTFSGQTPDQNTAVAAFVLTIRFDGAKATLTTGTAYRTFVLSKEPDQIWDHALPEFLAKKGIAWETRD